PPNHAVHPDLGIGPGAPHDGPYDHEIGDSFVQQGWQDAATFSRTEAARPNAIYDSWMVVPSDDAPTGRSPDSDNGPMIPNALFPIHAAFQCFVNGEPMSNVEVDTDIPPLDENLDPPFDVDGHSHFPMFFALTLGFATPNGVFEWRGSMVDATGAGW